MRTFSISLFVVFFSCCLLTRAQVPFPGECPKVHMMKTFDVDSYMGTWYEYARYPFIFEVGKRCMTSTLERVNNRTVVVMNKAINKGAEIYTNVKTTADIMGPGQLGVKLHPALRVKRPNYVVIGTDYTSYAVVYSCEKVFGLGHTKLIWILTRERDPEIEDVQAAKRILDENMITQTYLIKTVQDDCPDQNDDSTEDSTPADNTTEEIATLGRVYKMMSTA